MIALSIVVLVLSNSLTAEQREEIERYKIERTEIAEKEKKCDEDISKALSEQDEHNKAIEDIDKQINALK